MNLELKFAFAGLVVLAIGCVGEDGKDGSARARLDWTPDITAADFSQIGVPPPIVRNRIYNLRPGPATVFWRSNVTDYFLPVEIESGTPGEDGGSTLLLIPEDGEDGQDRAYAALLSGGTLFFDEQFVPIGSSFNADNTTLPGTVDRSRAIPGQTLPGTP